MNRFLTLLLLYSLSIFAYADYDSALAAYEAGDYETAFKELLPLAEEGHAEAQANIGFMYFKGLGVPQDYAEALKWYRKAAEQGHAAAQSNLGFMYYQGFVVPKDYVKAFAWVDIAVAGGDEPAQDVRKFLESQLNATQLKKARRLAKELSKKYGNKSKN